MEEKIKVINEEINWFIEKYQIKNAIQNNFIHVLKKNSKDELNLKSKDVTIRLYSLSHHKTDLGLHSFQVYIFHKEVKIGYYALSYSIKGELIDDFFVVDYK
ncbi:hypothetical protein LZQ00_11400 [Sphingobacterium sp. SRCM116780]|uniref:hypothetical protein n=1 Tax=Sphingobacterium sp. SRCM116780 TaxID=2907623 RepID=UPI001F3C7AC0|nr:hypothetical protein [Sphingobacterium sp. SRCM116780]UIR54884.1 hypothetical protein LZQ00_11400 [Sphingobacterium sp. SRCM116780]